MKETANNKKRRVFDETIPKKEIKKIRRSLYKNTIFASLPMLISSITLGVQLNQISTDWISGISNKILWITAIFFIIGLYISLNMIVDLITSFWEDSIILRKENKELKKDKETI